MKKHYAILAEIFLLMFFLLAFIGCASTSNEITDELTVNKLPGPEESLITIQRVETFFASAVSMKIWIDDKEVAKGIRNGEKISIIVPKGDHKIQVGSSGADKGNFLTIALEENEEIVFEASPGMGILSARFNINEVSKRNLSVIKD